MTRTEKTSQPREQTKQIALTDRELTTVTGGKVQLAEFTIKKLLDASTPRLG
jgi:hypothetical protein